MDTATGRNGVVVLRPMWSRFAWTATVAIGAIALPPFLALYWLTIPTGGWRTVLAIHAVTLLAATLATVRVRHAVIEIDKHEIREHGYFGRLVVTPRSEIASVLVVPVLAGSTPEVTTQLFVLDRQGRTRVRMLGQYWSDSSLKALEHAFDVPVRRVPSPLTRHELRAHYGPNLYWHERHPALTFAGVVVLCALVATPVFVVIEGLI